MLHPPHQLVAQTSPARFSVLTKEIGIPGESSGLPVGIENPAGLEASQDWADDPWPRDRSTMASIFS